MVPKEEEKWNERGRNRYHDFDREWRVIKMIKKFSGQRDGKKFKELKEGSSSREVALWAVESTVHEREFVVRMAQDTIQQRQPIPKRQVGSQVFGIPDECCECPVNFEKLVDGWRNGLIGEE